MRLKYLHIQVLSKLATVSVYLFISITLTTFPNVPSPNVETILSEKIKFMFKQIYWQYIKIKKKLGKLIAKKDKQFSC